MEVALGVLQVLGIFVGIPVVIGLAVSGGFVLRSRHSDRSSEAMTCSIDTDCPPGFVCRNGMCVPQGQA